MKALRYDTADLHSSISVRVRVEAVRQGCTHRLHPPPAPCWGLEASPALKGAACKSWRWQAGGNPGSSILSHTAAHNDPLLDSRVRGPVSRCQPPAIHESTQQCQRETMRPLLKSRSAPHLGGGNISDCSAPMEIKICECGVTCV